MKKKIIAALVSTLFAANAMAAPLGGVVVNGDAGIVTGAGVVDVNLNSSAVINWAGGFNVGAGETVNFNNGSGATAHVFNNDISGAMSSINGSINTTGALTNVYVINPNGINIGSGAQINTSGNFVATAGNLTVDEVAGANNAPGKVTIVLTSNPVNVDPAAQVTSAALGVLGTASNPEASDTKVDWSYVAGTNNTLPFMPNYGYVNFIECGAATFNLTNNRLINTNFVNFYKTQNLIFNIESSLVDMSDRNTLEQIGIDNGGGDYGNNWYYTSRLLYMTNGSSIKNSTIINANTINLEGGSIINSKIDSDKLHITHGSINDSTLTGGSIELQGVGESSINNSNIEITGLLQASGGPVNNSTVKAGSFYVGNFGKSSVANSTIAADFMNVSGGKDSTFISKNAYFSSSLENTNIISDRVNFYSTNSIFKDVTIDSSKIVNYGGDFSLNLTGGGDRLYLLNGINQTEAQLRTDGLIKTADFVAYENDPNSNIQQINLHDIQLKSVDVGHYQLPGSDGELPDFNQGNLLGTRNFIMSNATIENNAYIRANNIKISDSTIGGDATYKGLYNYKTEGYENNFDYETGEMTEIYTHSFSEQDPTYLSVNGVVLFEPAPAPEPTPEEPAPVDPAPVEPTPTEPTPVEPTPVEPTPVEPTPTEPTPVDPAPVEPTPTEPTPVDPAPVDPAPVEPTPVEPTPVEPTPVEPTPTEPTPVDPAPVEPTPVEPTPVEPTPVEPTPVEPAPAPLDPEPTPAPVEPTPEEPAETDPVHDPVPVPVQPVPQPVKPVISKFETDRDFLPRLLGSDVAVARKSLVQIFRKW